MDQVKNFKMRMQRKDVFFDLQNILALKSIKGERIYYSTSKVRSKPLKSPELMQR